MTESTTAPLTFIPFDEAVDGVFLDEAGRRNARGKTGVRLVDDQVFGRCAKAAGGSITLSALKRADFPNGFTLLVWSRLDEMIHMGTGGRLLTLKDAATNTERFRLNCKPVPFYGRFNYEQNPGPGWQRVDGNERLFDNRWQLLVLRLDGGGVLVMEPALAPALRVDLWGGAAPAAAATVELGDAVLPLSFARLRLYDRVLRDEEISVIRERDLHPPRHTSEPLPLTLSLEDSNAAHALSIEIDQKLTLRAFPNTRSPLELTPLSGEPSDSNWHFRVAFRPGTLIGVGTIRVGQGWKLLASSTNEIFLLAESALPLPVEILLSGVNADYRRGPQRTRVELAYQHVSWHRPGDPVELWDVRSQQLDVIEPAHAG